MSKTILASRLLSQTGLGALIRRTSQHHGFVALNYHRIGDPRKSNFDRGVFSGSSGMFEKQLRFLKKECDVITPDDIANLSSRSRGNYAMITFDDGYADNFEAAFPALHVLGLSAVFFVATGFLDQPKISWWDEIAWMVRNSKAVEVGPTAMLPACIVFDEPARERAIDSLLAVYKKLPPSVTNTFLNDVAESTGSGRHPPGAVGQTWMTWDNIREMRKAGMVIGGHTVNHPVLSTLSCAEQRLEILGCAQTIQENLGEPMRYFSYPRGKCGSFNADTRQCLREANVQYAFSYYGGMNHSQPGDPYDVHRVAVDDGMPLEHFEAVVTLPRLFA